MLYTAGHHLSRSELVAILRGLGAYALTDAPKRLPVLAWGAAAFVNKVGGLGGWGGECGKVGLVGEGGRRRGRAAQSSAAPRGPAAEDGWLVRASSWGRLVRGHRRPPASL